MSSYIVRRLFLMIPTLLLVCILVFLSLRLMPGSVIDLMQNALAGQGNVDRAELEHELGLDQPVQVQFGKWIGGLFTHGSLGTSVWTRKSVNEDVLPRIPVSFELGVIGILVGLLIAFPVGIYSATHQDTSGDYIGRSIAVLFIAMPNFWIGTMVVVFPAVWWHWIAPIGYVPITKDVWKNLSQFMIPGTVLGLALSGTAMRMTRTMMLEVLRQDYIRTAWAKGLNGRVVILRHALRNAMIPVLTVIGLNIPILIGGTVVIESIFSLPGMGRLFTDALLHRDYPTVAGINIVVACFVLITNLVVDLTYGYLDPRIKYK